jgi:hypothetical protein
MTLSQLATNKTANQGTCNSRMKVVSLIYKAYMLGVHSDITSAMLI